MLNSEDENPPPKRRNVTKECHFHRIAELQDKLKDIKDQIGFKSK